jgi:hypothetical protein
MCKEVVYELVDTLDTNDRIVPRDARAAAGDSMPLIMFCKLVDFRWVHFVVFAVCRLTVLDE